MVGLDLPVVPSGVVAAISLDRAIQILQRRTGISQPVHVRVDSMPSGPDINIDGRLRVLGLCNEKDCGARHGRCNHQASTRGSPRAECDHANSPYPIISSMIGAQLSDGGLRKSAMVRLLTGGILSEKDRPAIVNLFPFPGTAVTRLDGLARLIRQTLLFV